MPQGIVLSIYLGCTEFSAAENIFCTAQSSSVHDSALPQPPSLRRVTLRSITVRSHRTRRERQSGRKSFTFNESRRRAPARVARVLDDESIEEI